MGEASRLVADTADAHKRIKETARALELGETMVEKAIYSYSLVMSQYGSISDADIDKLPPGLRKQSQSDRESIVIALAIYCSRFCLQRNQEDKKYVPLETIAKQLGVQLVCFLTCCEELVMGVNGLDPGGNIALHLRRIKANMNVISALQKKYSQIVQRKLAEKGVAFSSDHQLYGWLFFVALREVEYGHFLPLVHSYLTMFATLCVMLEIIGKKGDKSALFAVYNYVKEDRLKPYCEKVYEFLRRVSGSSSSLPSKDQLDKAFLASFDRHAEADFRDVFCSPPNLTQLTPIHPSMKTRESLTGMASPYRSMTSLVGSPALVQMTPSSPFPGLPAPTPKDSSVTKMMIQDNWCYALLEKYEHQPTPYLKNLLRDCDGEDLYDDVDSRVRRFSEKVFQISIDPHNIRYCIQVGMKLYYFMLEANVKKELKRADDPKKVARLLKYENFHKAMMACSFVLVARTYSQTIKLDDILKEIKIDAFDLIKVIRSFAKLGKGLLPLEMIKQLSRTEETLIQGQVWKPGSRLIRISQQYLVSIESRPDFLDKENVPSWMEPCDIQHFIKKWKPLVKVIVNELDSKLNLGKPLINSVIDALDYALAFQTELFYSRELDQIILATIYGVARVLAPRRHLKLNDVVQAFQATYKASGAIVRQVPITLDHSHKVESRDSIIKFYNKVFLPAMGNHLMLIKKSKPCEDAENRSPGGCTGTPTQRLGFDSVDLVRPVTPDGNVTVSVMSPRREQIQFELRGVKDPTEKVAFIGQSTQPLQTYSNDIQKLNGNGGKHARDERATIEEPVAQRQKLC